MPLDKIFFEHSVNSIFVPYRHPSWRPVFSSNCSLSFIHSYYSRAFPLLLSLKFSVPFSWVRFSICLTSYLSFLVHSLALVEHILQKFHQIAKCPVDMDVVMRACSVPAFWVILLPSFRLVALCDWGTVVISLPLHLGDSPWFSSLIDLLFPVLHDLGQTLILIEDTLQ